MSTHDGSTSVGSAVQSRIFREALSRFPSGVTVVTTTDDEGQCWGFTANAFSSLSINPPLVLVCLADSADCYPAFMDAERFAINILSNRHEQLAMRFATKGAEKFAGEEFDDDPFGLPVLADSVATLRCSTHARLDGGDHVILVGRVEETKYNDNIPMLYFRGAFCELPSEEKAS